MQCGTAYDPIPMTDQKPNRIVRLLKGSDFRMKNLTHAPILTLRSFCAASLVAVAGLCPLALADLPGALDRVPGNAAIVIGITNLEASSAQFEKLFTSIGIPMPDGDESTMEMGKKLLATPGLNKSGSLAMAIVADKAGKIVLREDGTEKPTAVVIVPVTDYAAFVKALGGEKSDGVMKIMVDGQDGFTKDLGGGYAALSMAPGLLETFEGKAGNKDAHAKLLGKNGSTVADGCDFLIIANVAQMQDELKAAATQLTDQAEQMSAMLPADQAKGMANNAKIGKMVMENFARDGSAGVLAFKFGEKGLSIDIGAQFKEGSEIAGFFAASGKASSFMSKVPNLPYYFAGAVDFSAPGIKKIVKNLAALTMETKTAEEKAAVGTLQQTMAAADSLNGGAIVLGASPSAMMGGGLFVNTVSYLSSNDAAGMVKSMGEATLASNGRKTGPVTTKATYKAGATEVNGVKVDTWSTSMEFDPNDPMSGQAQMMTGMIFGQGGLTGMNAVIDGGIVGVYSQNTPLMTTAIDAAKTGKNSLADDALLKDAQSSLPANRTIEGYIGVKPLMDAAIGFMSMMGGGPEIKVPDKMSPVALGGTTNDGGVAFRLFVPSDVIAGIANVMKQSNAAEEEEEVDMDGDEAKPAEKAPRF